MLMEPNVFQPEFGPDALPDAAAAPSRHDYYPSHHIVDDDNEDDGEFRPALIDTTEYEHHQHHQQQQQSERQQQQRYRVPLPPPSSQRQLTRHNRKPTAYDITTPSAQSFLPLFFRDTVPPLGHSRPYYSPPAVPPQLLVQQQQQSQQSQLGNSIGVRSVGAQSSTAPPSADQAILGSGDFGVIRGGTFYQENDPPVRALESNDYFHFFKNNGHGRPQAAALQQQQQHGYGGSEEQFSNFRDFADINAPSDPAYSQFVVVYANKNASAAGPADDAQKAEQDTVADDDLDVTQPQPRRPQNIFEQLEALDREQPERYEVKVYKPLKPNSFKAKLAKTKLQKKYQKKGTAANGPKDIDFEPLMALS